MLVHEAKALAWQWVLTTGQQLPGFAGAFYHGSVNWLADDANLSPTSDLDIMLVFAEPPPVKLGKFVYEGVILEVSYISSAEVQTAEQILAQSHLAGSFMGPSIIVDPTGHLTAQQAVVARDYAKREWVVKRCEDVRAKLLRNLDSIKAADPFHVQVSAWLFGTGLTTHLPLVAGLENPTVRRRYLAARTLLRTYGYLNFYEELLGLLGCRTLRPQQVNEHLKSLTVAFDAAKAVVKSPFFFAADINDLARPVAIDGSRELIERGDHREAIFWIVATYARCQLIFQHDGSPALLAQFTSGFQRLLADLGIASSADLIQRGAQVKAFLPRLWHVTEAILTINPRIV